MNKDLAKKYIDIAAGEARGRHVSGGLGQDAVYALKSIHARDFRNRNYEGNVPVYVQVEAAVMETTPQKAADIIIESEEKWLKTGAHIERIRRAAKIQIDLLDEESEVSEFCSYVMQELKKV
jgi:hypothetical protein